MRVLLASTSGAGHFGPLVPFATAIRRAGHDILVAAPISAQSRVERAGLPFISFADPLEPDPAGERLSASPYLTLAPASFESPGEPVPARTLRFHDAPPPLRAVRSASEAPLVYMSFGSVAATIGFFPSLYRTVIDALAELPIRLLVTVGEAADPAELGPLPANARVERWIPQSQVFTRGGAGLPGRGGPRRPRGPGPAAHRRRARGAASARARRTRAPRGVDSAGPRRKEVTMAQAPTNEQIVRLLEEVKAELADLKRLLQK
jgi:UDP:flavonoid glycosyltransferase YjiC (YdhE family)